MITSKTRGTSHIPRCPVYLIMGLSGSGKSTYQKELSRGGVVPLVSITTRRKRYGEVEGEDYYFVEKPLDNLDNIIEQTTARGEYYYLSEEELHKCIKLGVGVSLAVSLSGLYDMLTYCHNFNQDVIEGKNNLGVILEPKVICLSVDYEEQRLRLILRGDNPYSIKNSLNDNLEGGEVDLCNGAERAIKEYNSKDPLMRTRCIGTQVKQLCVGRTRFSPRERFLLNQYTLFESGVVLNDICFWAQKQSDNNIHIRRYGNRLDDILEEDTIFNLIQTVTELDRLSGSYLREPLRSLVRSDNGDYDIISNMISATIEAVISRYGVNSSLLFWKERKRLRNQARATYGETVRHSPALYELVWSLSVLLQCLVKGEE